MNTMPGNSINQIADVKIQITCIGTGETKTVTGVLGLVISLPKNDCMSWSLTLDNNDRRYSKYNTSSAFYGYTDPTKNYRWTIFVITKGIVASSPPAEEEIWTYLTCTARSYKHNATDGYTVILTGTDYSYTLLKNNQTKVTQRSTPVLAVTMKAVLGSILTDYTVSSNLSALTDYKVKWLHMQGEIPLDVARKLLGPVWGLWRFVGNVFTGWQPVFKLPPTEPDYYIEDIETLEDFSPTEDRQSTITSVVVRRTSEISSIAFEETSSETAEHSIDVNSTAFPDGAVDLAQAAACVNGAIMAVWYWSETGKGGSNGGVPWGCPTPSAKSMSFYFQPTLGATTYSYHIVVRGQKPTVGEDPALTADYCVKYKNNTLETYLGEEYPAPEAIIDDLIPDVNTAKAYAQTYLQEAARKLETVPLVCGLYIKMRPGLTIAVKEWGSMQTRTAAGSRFFVESVTLDVGAGTTTIMASKYRPSDVLSQVTPWPPVT